MIRYGIDARMGVFVFTSNTIIESFVAADIL